MAKVSLRIYNREIESLIDQGHLDEAVAHCHHILKTFPKHLETYRLLGKAFLEAKRYEEAVDVFNRVLMAVPDDFVSHVGMSIIRDEENKLDDAIWHMERAFEAQPSNAAIQAEMQRLYGRRDGVEPPKIRMTRGALAHMYVQGELYPQAISEIRAVLATDPQRADMQVLLARAFFRAGQKADASDMCAQLLKRYPYCFDANRIMVELLPASERAESTQVYRHRVNELDPYSTFSKESVFQSHDVPDAAVNLDRLEYKGEDQGMGKDWGSSLGIGLSSSAAASEQPEWLRTGFADQEAEANAAPFPGAEPASVSKNSSDIPDFLRDAGWTESNGPAEESASLDTSSGEEALTPATIPDWLKGQMPVEPPPSNGGVGERPTVPPAEAPDWLSGLDAQPSESATPSADIPDWLSGLGGEQPAETPTPAAADVPDWLSTLGSDKAAESPAVPASDMPDWLSDLGSEQPAEPPATSASGAPDWLSGLESDQPAEEAAAPSTSEATDWFSGLGEDATSEPASPTENIPDWLKGVDSAQLEQPTNVEPPVLEPPEPPAPEPARPSAPASIESLGASAKEQDDAIAWLEMLAAKHGAKPEELVTDPAARSEKPPEWVEQARALAENPPAAAPAEEDAEQEERSMDETGVWLRDLSVKETESTSAQETEPAAEAEMPDWLKGLDTEPTEEAQSEQPIAKEEPPVEEAPEPEVPVTRKPLPQTRPLDEEALTQLANVPDWLIGMKDEEEEAAATQKDVSEWLSNLDEESKSEEAEPAATESESTGLPDWLSGLEQEETPAESEPSASSTEAPGWISELETLSVSGVEETEETSEAPTEPAYPVAEPEASTPVEATPASELPEWLRGLEQPEPERVEEHVEETPESIPSWLKSDFEEEEEPRPTPITPADWHPEETREEPPVQEEVTPQVEFAEPVQRVSPLAEPIPTPPPPDVVRPAPPISEPKPARPVRSKPVEPAQSPAAALSQAKSLLSRGDIPGSLAYYNKLIRKGKNLEDAIRDLRESLYRYPVEVGIWQSLGDAYMRANRLQEALDAYNKAEELLR